MDSVLQRISWGMGKALNFLVFVCITDATRRINSEFHTAPTVCHHRINKFLGKMEVGHTFTIEPIVCAGRNSYVTWPDSWTVCTSDGLPAAQFEHTLLITEKGADVLT